jgi:hypothetical protein
MPRNWAGGSAALIVKNNKLGLGLISPNILVIRQYLDDFTVNSKTLYGIPLIPWGVDPVNKADSTAALSESEIIPFHVYAN